MTNPPKSDPSGASRHPARRSIEETIEIDAPVEDVWRALTEAAELKKWFPLDARVKPGKGGTLWISWGPGCEGEAPIVAWEPNRRLGWIEEKQAKPDDTEQGPMRLAVDCHLETKGGKTVLRIVTSGFGTSSGWDGEIESLTQGWGWFARALRHYLEVHPGKERRASWFGGSAAAPRSFAWETLTGKDGFPIPAAQLARLTPGDRYAIRAKDGAVFEGKVLVSQPPRCFGGTVENLGNGLLFLEINGADAPCYPAVLLSTFGETTPETEKAHGQFEKRFRELFPG